MLEGEKTRLRKVEKADVWQLWEWHEVNKLRLIQRINPLMTIDTLLERYSKMVHPEQDYLIELKTGLAVGTCSVWNFSWKNSCCDLSLQMCEPDVGPSVSIDALSVIVSFLFFDLNLKTIQIVSPDKGDEIQVLENIGFQKEGKLREHSFYEGCFRDFNVYALSVADFSVWGNGKN